MHIMQKLLRSMRSNREMFEYVQPVLHAKVPIIRSRHTRSHIEIDISLHNMLVGVTLLYSVKNLSIPSELFHQIEIRSFG